ncbi:MAG: YggS family pyridoxal phosphate-dependent enzyme [Pseudomonadales bacterium]
MSTISSNLHTVQEQVRQAAVHAKRSPESVALIAVSKTQPAEAVKAAYSAGQRHFAENYVQEAVSKVSALADLDLCWHFIGRIQSNKARNIAEHFDWVHTVDRVKVARRLSVARQASHPNGPALNVCLQVNIDGDPAKAGLGADEIGSFAAALESLPGIRCRGLMTILQQQGEPEQSYARMADLYQSLRPTFNWDTLSMGMSGDYAQAIAHGSTMVRIGTAIFGPRRNGPGIQNSILVKGSQARSN